MPELPGGGAEKVLIDILSHFDFKKYDITLLLEYRQGIYLHEVPNEVKILSIWRSNTLWHQRIARRLMERGLYGRAHELWIAPLVRRKLRNRKFDTIVSFLEGAAVKIHSYLHRYANRNISWVHIDFEKKHWSLPFFRDLEDEKCCYEWMDKVACVSEGVKNAFIKVIGADEEKCMVVHNLIDSQKIRELSDIEAVPGATICMTGRLNRQKRYDRAIEAMKLLAQNGYDAKLRILGVGELENCLKKMAADAHLSDRIEFAGFQRPPYPWMKSCTIFLNTSESEGYPLSICEAMCLGMPVVATNISGAAEILSDDTYGMLTEENPSAISQALARMIDDGNLRKHYAAMSLERGKAFDVKNTMMKIYRLIDP